MTQLAQFINIIVSIFEWCEFTLGSMIVLVMTDWVQIEHDRREWREG